MRSLLPTLAFLAFSALSFSTAVLADADPAVAAATEEERVVYHINDAVVARAALRNAENHLAVTPDARIVFVVHGRGIDFLLNEARDEKGPYQTQVAGLKAKGVEFRVCRNTLKGRKLPDSALVMEAQIVSSGVAEIARLQSREGFVYLKP